MGKNKWQKLTALTLAAMMCGSLLAGCNEEEPTPEEKNVSLSVANVNIAKAAGETVALTAEGLGLTVSEGATLSYQIVKKQCLGESVEAYTASNNQITVEEGYFYDIMVTATVGEKSVSEYVQVKDEDSVLFGFESASEKIPTIGTGVVQWHKTTENGNSMMKMYRPPIEGADNGNVPMKLDDLFMSANIECEETEQIYAVYADVSYAKELDAETSWGIQLTREVTDKDDDAYVTNAGRYYIGEASWDPSGYRMVVNFWARTLTTEFAIDGVNNYALWDNVAFVAVEKEEEPDPVIPEPEVPETYETLTVANKTITKSVGDTVALNETTLGFTAPTGGSVAYTVEKVQAAGTEKEVLTLVGNQFTVEEGYFYDISVLATDANGEKSKGYAQVRTEGMNLFSFEEEDEVIPIVGSGVVQWHKMDLNGNGMMKMYRPVHPASTAGAAPVKLDELLTAGNLPGVNDTSVTYKVYADIAYYKLDSENSWGVQLIGANPAGAWVTEKTGRYYLGEAKWNSASQRFELNIMVRTLTTAYAIDGENNFCMFDNVVLVAK